MLAPSWTEDRVKRMRELFAAKHSATEIAATLGGISRNAVCGKLARLGLVRGWGPRHPDKPAPKKRAAAGRKNPPLLPGAPKFNPEPFVCAAAFDIAPLNLALTDLQEGDCKWPYDAPAGSSISHVFCGHPSLKDKPYCKGHTAIATAGLPPRKAVANPGEFGKSRGGVFGRMA